MNKKKREVNSYMLQWVDELGYLHSWPYSQYKKARRGVPKTPLHVRIDGFTMVPNPGLSRDGMESI